MIAQVSGLKKRLDALDAANAARIKSIWQKLNSVDQLVGKILRKLYGCLGRFDNILWRGASKGLTRKKTGNPVLDFLSRCWFNFWQIMDRWETRFFYPDYPYQTKTGRVRSKAEKIIDNWFYDQRIPARYEAIRVTTDSGCYIPDWVIFNCSIKGKPLLVEFWGLMDDPAYRVKRQEKDQAYKKQGYCFISLEPGEQGRMAEVFPKKFKAVTGMDYERWFKKARRKPRLPAFARRVLFRVNSIRGKHS